MAKSRNEELGIHLPNEILISIFSFFAETPAPSSLRLHLEPTVNITSSETCDLKSISLTSRLWRQLVLPLLFKHLTFGISPETFGGQTNLYDFINFLHTTPIDKSIGKYATSLALRVSKIPFHWEDVCYTIGCKDLWRVVFATISPTRLTIVAPPKVIDSLISSNSPAIPEHWSKLPHILSLEQKPTADPCPALETQDTSVRISDPDVCTHAIDWRDSSPVLNRPWTHFILNEGPQERFHDFRQAPESILEGPLLEFLFPPTVRDFAFIAMFPAPIHFANLVWNLPRVDRFFCQLVPREMSLSADSSEMDSNTMQMWDRRNLSYSYLMRYMLSDDPIGNFRYLQDFESGDATDTEAFSLVSERAVSLKKGWRVERDGVLVRDQTSVDKSRSDSDSDGGEESDGLDDEEGGIFSGNLMRWAWNGTAKLPVSPLPLYFR